MFGKLKDFFAKGGTECSLEVDKDGNPTSRDLHIATAVLLVEMASSDKEIAPEEGEAVVSVMCNQFNLDESEMQELIGIAVSSRKEVKKIDQFVKYINDNLNEMQRQKILVMLWKVVIADGKIDKYEERLTTQMRVRFQLTEEQAREARRLAEEDDLSDAS